MRRDRPVFDPKVRRELTQLVEHYVNAWDGAVSSDSDYFDEEVLTESEFAEFLLDLFERCLQDGEVEVHDAHVQVGHGQDSHGL
jgi:hypothetical protein